MSDASRLSLMMLLVPFKLQRLRVKEFTFTKSRGLVDDVLSALVPGHVVPQMWGCASQADKPLELESL